MKTLSFILTLTLSLCSLTQVSNALDMPPQSEEIEINLIPMYGYPDIEKNAWQKKMDEQFIRCVVADNSTAQSSVSTVASTPTSSCPNPFPTKAQASNAMANLGWKYLRSGDGATAMKRFNQAWLLNENNYQAFWGFGTLSAMQNKLDKGISYFEKALSLLDNENQRSRLLNDTAEAYSMQGAYQTDKTKSQASFARANALLEEAVKLALQNSNIYITWAISLYREENYPKSWEMVKKARSLSGRTIPPNFIEALTKKMPEPRE